MLNKSMYTFAQPFHQEEYVTKGLFLEQSTAGLNSVILFFDWIFFIEKNQHHKLYEKSKLSNI